MKKIKTSSTKSGAKKKIHVCANCGCERHALPPGVSADDVKEFLDSLTPDLRRDYDRIEKQEGAVAALKHVLTTHYDYTFPT